LSGPAVPCAVSLLFIHSVSQLIFQSVSQ